MSEQSYLYAKRILEASLRDDPDNIRALKLYARLHLSKTNNDLLDAGRMLERALDSLEENWGKEISYIRCLMAKQLTAAFHLLQVSGRNQEADLYHEFHRELQPAAPEGDQKPYDLSDG